MIKFVSSSDNSLRIECGDRIVGMIVKRLSDGVVVWQCSGDLNVRHFTPAAYGEASTISQAKRSFRRFWKAWLAAMGLEHTSNQ
jgi:hypothetical protein